MPIYGDGSNIREWIHVSDHCEALNLVLEKGTLGHVYNIGGGEEKTNLEIVETLLDLLPQATPKASCPGFAPIEFVEDRKGHDRRYSLDSSKIRNELGWIPRVSFGKGLEDTVHWYLSNKDWLFAMSKNIS